MAKLRVHNYSMSLDGYVAGPDQSLDEPLGIGAEALHEWVFATPSGRRMMGQDPGDAEAGVDEDFFLAGEENIGAHVMGRNMFGPVRGEWGGSDWTGWWGPEPPYHHHVFVLTHHAKDTLPVGETTFHFVTDGIESALEQAFEAAGGQDVRLGGGCSTVRQYLRAGLVDELHIPIAPVLLRGGERLFDDPADLDGYEVVDLIPSATVAHMRLAKA